MSSTEVAEAVDAVAGATVVKKRPGRPRKTVQPSPIAISGIAPKPSDDKNIVELEYCHPSLFKEISQLLKKFAVDELELNFCEDGLHINATDHLKKSLIYITVSGTNMNHYYCQSPIKVNINRRNAEIVLNTLDKDVPKITFILRNDHRSTLYIITKCSEYNNDELYEISVGCREHKALTQTYDDKDYPLKFKFSSKYFKRKINELRAVSDRISIQKIGTDPMQLGCGESTPVKWSSTGYDDALVDMRSALVPGEILNVSMMIDYIKPLSDSSIGDNIHISIDKKERACFSAYLNRIGKVWTCTIRVFTEITDFRQTDMPK